MALIKSIKGLTPKWGRECYFSENATIVGEVTMGDECSVWFNAVVRGDVAPITIGNRTNIQDGACVHVTNTTGPTVIGNDVSIGHNATVHACTIRDGALIGMGATLLDHCDIGEGAVIKAGATVGAPAEEGKNPVITVVGPGCTVGENETVPAGEIVDRDDVKKEGTNNG